jgi:Kdo2-lipid IVA lauroyltransferase/acyltransferase
LARRVQRLLRGIVTEPLLRAGVWLAGKLSWRAAQKLGRVVGILARVLDQRDRRLMAKHLEIAFPEKSRLERRQLEKLCWRHLGMSAFELLHLRGRPPGEGSKHVEVLGFEAVEKARAEGKAVVILTGHCGNWELISTANASHGLGLAAIARELDQADVQDFAVDLRRHLGSETIARGSATATRQLLRVLRSKGSLVLLIDQDIKEAESVFVPFFGKPAWTPTAATDLALRLGAAVVPTFAERLEDGSHKLTFHPALDLPPDVTEATAIMTAEIENQIRRHPEQWVWMHRRWRRQPAEAGPSGG